MGQIDETEDRKDLRKYGRPLPLTALKRENSRVMYSKSSFREPFILGLADGHCSLLTSLCFLLSVPLDTAVPCTMFTSKAQEPVHSGTASSPRTYHSHLLCSINTPPRLSVLPSQATARRLPTPQPRRANSCSRRSNLISRGICRSGLWSIWLW